MKRILASTALVLALSGSNAVAGSHVTGIKLDGYCDNFTVTLKGNVAVAQDAPSCSGMYGGGLVAGVKVFGKSVLLALQDQTGSPGVQIMLELSYPFTPTGTFRLYQTTDGTVFQDAVDGTYTMNGAPENDGGKPVTGLLHH
jgi:hypothetical protein